MLDKGYYLPRSNDTITIEKLRFYVSNISLFKKGKAVVHPTEAYHLIDVEGKLQIPFALNSPFLFDSIRFDIGVDSVANVSGALGGDLDPTNGMYWAWQSGYINFKLEGTSKRCRTRNAAFQFHIGGYSSPNASLQTVTLPFRKEGIVLVDIEKLLADIDLSTMNEIMSPGAKALRVATMYKTIFSMKE